MRKTIQILLILSMLLGGVIVVTAFLRVDGVISVGPVILGGILVFASGILLFYSSFSSPENRSNRQSEVNSIKTFNKAEMGSWLEVFLITRFSINIESFDQDLRDFGISRADINSTLDDLEIDYSIPISSEDSRDVSSAADICNIVAIRRSVID